VNLLRAFLMGLVLVGAIAFAAGFWAFADSVRAPAADPPPKADAIVALTGGSLQRLSTGVRLLKQARGRKLLISGVNRNVADHELYQLLDIDTALGACCVELGRGAEDTLGNASETAAWAKRNHFDSLILVTDDYHMPRSYAELSLAMPHAKIHRYPVRTRWTDPALWRRDFPAATRLGAEYVKYLMIRGREALIALSGEDKRAAAADGQQAQ
jgi:uncharacterized SAM-binding protein YcdF (DUF218 family)